MKPEFKLMNFKVDVTSGIIDFTDTAIVFDGADTYETYDALTLVENVFVDSHDKQGTLIEMHADEGGEYVTMCHIHNVKGHSMEYGVHLHATNTGAGTAWINCNIFEGMIFHTCIHPMYLDLTGGGTKQIDGNIFTNFIQQYGSAGEDMIYCEGNWNRFSGISFDYNAGTETGLIDISGDGNFIETNIVYSTCDMDEVTNTGTDNRIMDTISEYFDWQFLRSKKNIKIWSYGGVNTGIIELSAGASVRFQPDAWNDIWCFSNSGTGENKSVHIYGRNLADSAKGYLGLRWGGTADGAHITTHNTGGPIFLEPDNNITKLDDILFLKTRSSAPGSPVEGYVYVNSTDHHVYCYLNGSWVQLDN